MRVTLAMMVIKIITAIHECCLVQATLRYATKVVFFFVSVDLEGRKC